MRYDKKYYRAFSARFQGAAWLLLLVSLPLAPQARADRPAPAGTAAGNEAAIRQVLGAYEDSWNRHDAHAFSLIFAPDAEFVNVRGIAYPGGRAGIERAHRPLFAAMFAASQVTTDRVQITFVRPDVAAADVYWHMTGSTDRVGKPRGLVQGLRNMVLTREGKVWRIAVFHNMEIAAPNQVPAPPAQPPAGRGG